MKNSKLKAFTLMEVVIVMLLSVTVCTITYLAFSIVSKQFLLYQKNTRKVTEVMRLNRALGNDIINANMVVLTEEGIKCILDSSSVEYLFDSSFVLRKAASIDSIWVRISTSVYSFQQEEVQSAGEIIDELRLMVLNEEDSPLVILRRKNYDAKALMQYQKNRH